MTSAPRLILGTMTFGHTVPPAQSTPAVALQQLRSFQACKMVPTKTTPPKILVDTARMYQAGTTEEVIGDILSANPDLKECISIATKANAKSDPPTLAAASVKAQCQTSLDALKLKCIDLFYLHWPDITVPIEETLQAVTDLHKEGKILEFGLSNYPSWMVVDIWHKCKLNGWIQPTVYQGVYNAINRDIEGELLPALRTCGMRFYAYNPLAGGMLTGKHNAKAFDEETQGERFDTTTMMGAMYRKRYWKTSTFEALKAIETACQEASTNMVAAALRWILYHSYLKEKHCDGIILGASSLSHLEQNLVACEQGPLPEPVLQAMNAAWAACRPEVERYFRGMGPECGDASSYMERF